MTGVDIVTVMVGAALLLWGMIALRFSPAILRGFRRDARDNDQLRAFLFFVAVLQIAFIVRRLTVPDDNGSLTGLYALSIMCACVGIMVLRGYDRDA